MSNDAAKPYAVLVDDNFNYMDEDKRYEHGTHATLEQACGLSGDRRCLPRPDLSAGHVDDQAL